MMNNAVIEMGIKQERWIDYQGDNSMPTGTKLACRYALHIMVDTIEEEALFRRSGMHDELWLHWDGTGSYVFYAARAGAAHVACRRLFEFMARYRRYEGLLDCIEGGLIACNEYNEILEKVRQDHESSRQEALAQETPIVKMARRLGLMPAPNGLSRNQWTAQCPRGNHWLMISAKENAFGCGYCKVKGNLDELRNYAEYFKKRRCK